jgi:hypothetical protein
MVRVNRAEYEALRELRDHAHEKLRADCETQRVLALKHKANYDAVLAINYEQVTRLNAQDLKLTHTQTRLAALERENARLTKELEAVQGKKT